MATCIQSSRSCLPPFYTIPIFPLFERLFFFWMHTAFILYSEEYIVFMSCCRNCVMYVCQLSVLQLLIWPVIGIFIHFKWRLPEAICCCLQTCNVDVVLLVMYCMYIPAFTVTSANKSQLCVYSCYLLISCLRLFVFVYKAKFAKLRPLPCGRPSGRRVLTSLFSLSLSLVLTLISWEATMSRRWKGGWGETGQGWDA